MGDQSATPLTPTPLRRPLRAHLLVCTAAWELGCRRKGSEEILARFQRELRDRGLRSEAAATACECVGGCRLGPNVVVYPDGVWYGAVSPDDVPAIVEQHVVGGAPVARLLRRDRHGVQDAAYAPAGAPGASGPSGGPPFPRMVVDGLERVVTISAFPEVAAAASPIAGLILEALVPSSHIGTVEEVLRRPPRDRAVLLLADADASPETIAAADAAAVPLVALGPADYVPRIQANVGLAARALGAEVRAAELNARIDAQLEACRARAEAAERPTRAIYYTAAGTAAGPYSLVGSLISSAGGEKLNELLRHADDDYVDRVPLPMDVLAGLNPDVILLEPTGVAPDLREQILAEPRLSQTEAVRSGRVCWLDLAVYGERLRSHRVVEAIADIHRFLYPAE
jgi:(2Fe-2S) ferredoxin/ABC-type hemin transport system substrate-binding protein